MAPLGAAAPKAEPWPQLPMEQLLVPSKGPWLSPRPPALPVLRHDPWDLQELQRGGGYSPGVPPGHFSMGS